MAYKVQFFSGEGNHFSGPVNYLMSPDRSIYAEVAVPEGASEDYGYLAMKRAILKSICDLGIVPEIEWHYDEKSEKLLEPDASADAEVYLNLQLDEEAPLWYAVMLDREYDDWGTGSRSLKEAMEMARAQRDDHPEVYIAVISDGDNPVCIDEIELDD